MTDLTRIDDSKGVGSFIKREWHLAPRALIASIPFIGHAISVVIEDLIVRRQQDRIIEFTRQLSQRLAADEAALDKISEDLFLFAAHKATDQSERWKPKAIANILAAERKDNATLFKHLMIDHTSQLTDFDLAIFWDISGANPENFPSETRYALLELQTSHPEVKLLRGISERKLVQLGFLRQHTEGSSRSFVVTDIGNALIAAI
jgi:hypothetical protein